MLFPSQFAEANKQTNEIIHTHINKLKRYASKLHMGGAILPYMNVNFGLYYYLNKLRLIGTFTIVLN